MPSVSSAMLELCEWLMDTQLNILTLIRNSKRTMEQLQPLNEAMQAIVDDGPFRVEYLESTIKSLILGIPSRITLPAIDKPVDPEGFFRTGQGLYVWDSFRNRILSVAKEVKSLPARDIMYVPLLRAATDAGIRAELPEGHVFTNPSAGCAYIADMIQRQANGEDGPLLNNGIANIFYFLVNSEVFAVGVYWHSGGRGWSVDACRLGGSRWRAGHRAFSATAVA